MIYRTLLFCLLLCTAGFVSPLAAQPLVDGVTIGGGVSLYQGEFDFNPRNDPARFIASGTLHAFVGVDRAVGAVIFESTLQYDRLRMDGEALTKTVDMISLDVTGSVPLQLPRPVSVRLFAGVSPALQFNSYDRINAGWQTRVGYEETGTRMVVTFPIGVVLQDVVRVGIRLAGSAQFDGYARDTNPIDFITFVSVGYRFDLLR